MARTKKTSRKTTGGKLQKGAKTNRNFETQIKLAKAPRKQLATKFARKTASESVDRKEINIMKTEDLPDYEKDRLKNIAEQKAMFLVSLKKRALALSATTKPKSNPKPPTSRAVPNFCRKKIVKKKYATRSSVKQNSDDSGDEGDKVKVGHA